MSCRLAYEAFNSRLPVQAGERCARFVITQFNQTKRSAPMNYRLLTAAFGAILTLAGAANSSLAATIVNGSASLTIVEGLANAVSEFDAYFDDMASRAQALGDPAPGNALFTETPADPATGSVTLVDPIRPSGVTPAIYPGTPGSTRSRQVTTLDFDPNDVLGSWDVSDDAIAFVGGSTLGEQIAFTSMQRYTGPFPGALLYGDFGLRYTGSRLVLTSNIDFLNAAFAEIGNPNISVVGNTLTISGELLMAAGLSALDPTAVPGTDFGDFTMTATIVPEPTTAALLGAGVAAALALSHRRSGQLHVKQRTA